MIADTDQSGPFNILNWLRSKAGVRYNEHSKPYVKEGSLADLLTCIYCNSIWIGILFTIGLVINIKVTTIVSLPLALSAIAIVIEEWINHGKE